MKNTLRRLSACSLALAILTQVAVAEDRSPLDWSGFYLGGQIGATSLGGTLRSLDFCDGSGQCVSDFSALQAAVGVVVGYDLNIDDLVVGAEVSANAKFGEASSLLQGFDSYQGDWMTSSPWDASATARIGVLVTPEFLLFATGGASVAAFDLENTNCPECAEWGDGNLHGESRFGWVAGVGGEFALDERWHLRAQYLHADYGDFRTTGEGMGYEYSSRITTDTVQGGITFRMQ